MKIIKLAQEDDFIEIEILVRPQTKSYKILTPGLGKTCDKVIERIQNAEGATGLITHNDNYLKPAPVVDEPSKQQVVEPQRQRTFVQ